MRSRFGVGAVLLSSALLASLSGAFLASCTTNKQGIPAPLDHSAEQQALWKLCPADADGGLVVVSAGRVIDRLRALDAALESGPATKEKLVVLRGLLQQTLGFDPLEKEQWKTVGIDVEGPVAVFMHEPEGAQILFRATDADKLKAVIEARGPNSTFGECTSAGTLLRCGPPSLALAADVAHSLWPEVEANVPAARVGAEALAFVPLKHGRFAKQATESQSPLKGAQAAWLGMNLTPERFAMYWGMRADDLKSVAPYLKPREGQSLLGLATGGIGAGRITFSPDVSWKAIKEAAGDKLDTVTGAVAAATALDAEKDFIENLTGEMVFATYRSDSKTDQAGKPLDLRGRASTVIVFGSRDDVRTRNVSEKLGGLIGGAVASYGDAGEQLGVKMSTRTDAGDRPVRWVTLDLQETAKTYLGLDHLDVFLTSIPGGLVLGYGKTGLVELLKRVGKKPAAFLDTLPLPEEKAPFSTSPFVAWARAGEGFGQRLEQAKAMTGLDDLLPGAQKILLEVTALGQLMFDSFVAFDLSGDRAELFFQVTFL